MAWKIIFDEVFEEWFESESLAVQDAIAVKLQILAAVGPNLGRPSADTLKNSSLTNLKELRVPVQRRPYRILFVFDPRRQAILLVGGDKSVDKRWYDVSIPIAEARYARHLERLRIEDEDEKARGKKP